MNSSGYGSTGRPVAVPAQKTLSGLWRLARPRQWVKNGFVFAPLFFTPPTASWDNLLKAFLVFIGFCLISSAVYCFNDYRDRDADRRHPVKRYRPLAAGVIGVKPALVFATLLVVAGFVLMILASPEAAFYGFLYLGANVGYSLALKRYPIIDVLTISIGFVLRIYAGAAAVAITPTVWIQVCAGLLALFIALAKRRDDLVKDLGMDHRESLSGYSKSFLDTCVVVTLAALLVSYLIFTTDQQAMARLGSDKLFLTTPFVVAGLFRYLQLMLVYERSGSPADLLFSDRFLLATVVAWIASFAYMMYL